MLKVSPVRGPGFIGHRYVVSLIISLVLAINIQMISCTRFRMVNGWWMTVKVRQKYLLSHPISSCLSHFHPSSQKNCHHHYLRLPFLFWWQMVLMSNANFIVANVKLLSLIYFYIVWFVFVIHLSIELIRCCFTIHGPIAASSAHAIETEAICLDCWLFWKMFWNIIYNRKLCHTTAKYV